MITEILTPLDGTKVAETALPWARDAASRLDATVRLLHVIVEDGVGGSQRDSMTAYMRQHQQSLFEAGVRAEVEIAGGRPADVIVERASRAHLTVMTSGTVRWMVSAVLDRVLQEVTTPVVIVRGSEGDTGHTAAGGEILVPIDGTGSTDVLPTVSTIARCLEARVVLLHVIPPVGEYSDPDDAPPGIARLLNGLADESEALLERAAGQLRNDGLDIETIIEIGEPDRTIVRVAEKTDASLIAMATRGRDTLDKRVGGGSVANAVMESTRIPCLFVRAVRDRVPA